MVNFIPLQNRNRLTEIVQSFQIFHRLRNNVHHIRCQFCNGRITISKQEICFAVFLIDRRINRLTHLDLIRFHHFHGDHGFCCRYKRSLRTIGDCCSNAGFAVNTLSAEVVVILSIFFCNARCPGTSYRPRNISICHIKNISSLLKFSQILRCKNRKFRTGPVGKAIRCRIQVIHSVKTGQIRICNESFYNRLFVIEKAFQQGKLPVSNCKNATVAFLCFSKSIFLFL